MSKKFKTRIMTIITSVLICVVSAVGVSADTTTKSPFTGVTYTHKSSLKNVPVVNGIDVSQWQGDIDWNRVKADGVKYVFIRAGFRASATGILTADYNYEANVKGALDAGLNVGLYIFSQATTKAKAVEEAKYLINKAKGYDINMPLIMDFEYNGSDCILAKANLTNAQRTKICNAFLSYVKTAGYVPMLYANYSMLSDDLNSASLSNKYKIWIARYNSSTGYAGDYDFWQYADNGKINGIKGNVDCNFWYNDGTLKAKDVDAESVILSKDQKTVATGKKFTLTATVMPENTTETYRWTSSNPQVAFISDEGVVRAVSKGTTVITATTSKGLKATCKVTVKKNIKDYKVVLKSSEAKYTYTGEEVNPTFTVRSKKKNVTRIKTKDSVYLRTGPSLAYTAIELVKKGRKINVYGSISNEGSTWYAVRCKIGGKTRKGYICGDYAKVLKRKYDNLTRNTDYTRAYSDNVEIGNALITLTGTGNVSGSKTKKYTIGPKKVDNVETNNTSSYIELTFGDNSLVDGYVVYKSSSKDGVFKECSNILINEDAYTDDEGVVSDESRETTDENGDVTDTNNAEVQEVEYEIAENAVAETSENTEEAVRVCKDTSVKNGHEYYYKVYAYKVVGGNIITSRSSKVVTANCKFEKTVKAKLKDNCNVRKGAGTAYKSLGIANKNKKFKVYAITHDAVGRAWIKVKFTTASGKKKYGYILKSLVKFS